MSRARILLLLVLGLCAPQVLFAASTDAAQPAQANESLRAIAAPARPILDWRGVESEDYRAYVKNLQAIGCPAQTIRDIVMADVVSAYAARREEVLAARCQNFKYWKTDAAETAARATLASKRQIIDDEMSGALKELLGRDTLWVDTSGTWRKMELEFELAFLPMEKRQPVTGVILAYTRTDEQMKELAGGLFLTDDTNEPAAHPAKLR